MKIINHPDIPPANGHYSHCVEHNGVLYLSGQLPVLPESRSIPTGIEAQAKLVFSKMEQILLAAGSSKEKVLQVRIYIPDVELWDQVNAAYSDFFGTHKPARCVVPTGRLHYGCLIEVEAIAHL
jgi:2-iminobutanoate/2-iminopropanoate deaminase